MSLYRHVLPRDLFNEASLLKCYGQLWLHLEGQEHAELEFNDAGLQLRVLQDEADGGIWIDNVVLKLHGLTYELKRPLNSRAPWPLYVVGRPGDPDFDEIAVFTDDGELTPEMRRLIQGGD